MGHIPPAYGTASCPANLFTYTDDPVVADTTEARGVHRNELRGFIVTESARRGLIATPIPNTDQPAVADQTEWRKIHLDELRTAIEYMKAPTEIGAGWCPSDSSPAIVWTDPTITADQTLVRAVHINELRTTLNVEAVTCVCELEACNYCSDCGYAYNACSLQPCACDDHKYNECGYTMVWVYSCATINQPQSNFIPQVAYWNCMCNFTPPGIGWNTYAPPHSPGYSHPSWGCMCNPYTWTT